MSHKAKDTIQLPAEDKEGVVFNGRPLFRIKYSPLRQAVKGDTTSPVKMFAKSCLSFLCPLSPPGNLGQCAFNCPRQTPSRQIRLGLE
jgi:hypothetical protein